MNRYVYFVRGQPHLKLAGVSMAAVRKVDPEAVIELYTDDPAIEGKKIPAGMPIMLANLEAQCRAMYAVPEGDLVTFLDTDVLLLKRPDFRTDFDIGATWRDRVGSDEEGNAVEGLAKVMPYNYGVIFARGGFAATEGFLWMRERIRRMSKQMQDWYGNQVALAALAGPRPSDGYAIDCRRLPWTPTMRGNNVWVSKIPCTEWNFTPRGMDDDLTGVGALHFKGKSRHLMEGHARKLDLPWPLPSTEAA